MHPRQISPHEQKVGAGACEDALVGTFDVDVMVAGFKVGQVGELALATKSAGLSGVAFTEGGRTAYLGATAAALAADGLDVATAVAVAFPRSPMVTASIAWELAELTHGRFLLGLGTQVKAHVERRYSAEFDPPGPRLREYVLALRAIFAGFQETAPLNFEGDYYHFSLLPPTWSPGPIDYPDVPIYIRPSTSGWCRMAGEVADGIQVHPFHSPTYLRDTLQPGRGGGRQEGGPRSERRQAGRAADDDRRRHRGGAGVPARAGPHADRVLRLDQELRLPVRPARLRRHVGPDQHRPQGRRHGGHGRAHHRRDARRSYSVEASWDDLADVLLDRYDGLADRLVLYFASEMWRRDRRALDRFGEVAKALRAG